MIVHTNTLRKLLSTLVDDCGYDVIRNVLNDLAPAHAGKSASRDEDGSVMRPRKPRAKPDAVAVVNSLMSMDEEKKNILMALARRYEDKMFMPNVNHVRAFLEREGEDASRIKSRQQAVSAVFRYLADWDAPRLQDLDSRGLYGPPKSLSTIAGSIENFGRQNRRTHEGATKRMEKPASASS